MKKIVITFFITEIVLLDEYKLNNPFKPMKTLIGSFVIGVFLLVFNQ
jgi:RsiW-degrading membrane proteinase PrsW (M82 family)